MVLICLFPLIRVLSTAYSRVVYENIIDRIVESRCSCFHAPILSHYPYDVIVDKSVERVRVMPFVVGEYLLVYLYDEPKAGYYGPQE